MKRVDKFEFRYSEFNKKYELIQWDNQNYEGKEFCFVLAFFDKESEGYSIRFVGDRPFRANNDELVWAMLKYGQAIVDAEFNLEDIK